MWYELTFPCVEVRPLLGCFLPKQRRKVQKAVNFVMRLDGLIGLREHGAGTLCFFESEEKAKKAKAAMEELGLNCSEKIEDAWISTQDEKFVDFYNEVIWDG